MPDQDNNDPGQGSAFAPEAASDAASYIASLAGELALLARRNGLHTLSHLLDMAQLEASENAKD
jgi:hypothetical protein